jgi:hypothetical protein
LSANRCSYNAAFGTTDFATVRPTYWCPYQAAYLSTYWTAHSESDDKLAKFTPFGIAIEVSNNE